MKMLLKDIIRSLEHKMGKVDYGYDYEQDAKEAIAIVRQNTMVAFEPLVTLYRQVRDCEMNHICGDFVECGVWKGGAIGLMALAKHKFSQGEAPFAYV